MAKALVVYATITGNNEDVADIITDTLEDLGQWLIQLTLKKLIFV